MIGPGLLGCVAAGIALRWWALGSVRPSFDESFTGVSSSHPGALFNFLRLHDAHPPLDYLIRAPFAQMHSAWWLRFPSGVFATATLLVVAWWWRDRGRLGLLVVALTAGADFQLIHGRQARMYALMILCGTVVGFVADRWRREGGRRWVVVVGVTMLVALFTHVSSLLIAFGVLLIPGWRWRREDVEWRLAVVVPVGCWTVLWGPAFREQMAHSSSSWVPYTTPGGVLRAVSGLVTTLDGLAWLVMAAIGAGLVVLARTDRVLLRLAVCLLVVPTVLLAVAGVHAHVLLSRTLGFAAFVPVIALAALVEECAARRWLVPAAAIAGLIVLCQVAGYPTAFHYDDGSVHGMARLEAVARPGDEVAVHPAWYSPLIDWAWAGDGGLPRAAAIDRAHDLASIRVPGTPTGRMWLLEPVGYRSDLDDLPACAPLWQDADERLLCLVVGSAGP